MAKTYLEMAVELAVPLLATNKIRIEVSKGTDWKDVNALWVKTVGRMVEDLTAELAEVPAKAKDPTRRKKSTKSKLIAKA